MSPQDIKELQQRRQRRQQERQKYNRFRLAKQEHYYDMKMPIFTH